jgi:assimilatory nitrate reductase catalytic subunit
VTADAAPPRRETQEGAAVRVIDIAPADTRATTVTASTCCFCGVGCGVLIESAAGRITAVRGDPDHPANQGRLCSKGMALAASAQSDAGRACYPSLRLGRDMPRQRVDWDTALDTVAARFADTIERHGPDSVAFYVSGQLLTEDYYVFNKLAKGLIGTNNIDTNSRLCMSSAVTGYKLAFGADGPPTCYDDLEAASTVFFAGSNTAYAHPVVYRRLEEARAKDPGIKWVVIDPRVTDTAALADLHLRIQPGTDVALFNGMLHHLIWEGLVAPDFIADHTADFDALKRLVRTYTPAMAAQLCGIAEADLITAAEWFGTSRAALSLYCMGLNQSSHGTDKNLALINLHLACAQIGRPGAGPFSLTGQPNAMGGREVGGMATMLAAHREIGNPADRAEVERLWGVEPLSATPGLPAVALFDALAAGTVKAVWIVCTNPAHSMPDLPRVRAALGRAEFVVVQDAFANTDTVAFADVLLPASSWGEKEGTVTNSERRISRVRAAVAPPGEARADWWIAVQAAQRLEGELAERGMNRARSALFGFTAPESIFDEHRLLTAGRDLDIGGLSYGLLETAGPQQWPMPPGAVRGRPRLYTTGRFAYRDGRARFHAVDYQAVAEPVSARFPFHLLSGRLRDQWHGMSRTGRVAQLFAHAGDPALSMHPADAERRGLREGELVRIVGARSERDALILPLALAEDVASGTVFAAMHWNAQFLASGGVNEVTRGAVDPRSFQPELKHAAVRIEAAGLGWQVYAACAVEGQDGLVDLQEQLQPLLGELPYAALGVVPPSGSPGATVVSLRAAAAQAQPAWLARVAEILALQPGADVVEYSDARRGLFKRARWASQRLAAFVLAGAVPGMVSGATATHASPAAGKSAFAPSDDARLAASLRERLAAGAAWQGSRLAVFAPGLGGPPDKVVCTCMNVHTAALKAAFAGGADVAAVKATLGCGTVCGSCVPELVRLHVHASIPA